MQSNLFLYEKKVKNQDMGKLIDMNYRLQHSDFYRCFVQGIIAASTSYQTDEHILAKRHIAALKTDFKQQSCHIAF